MVACPRCVWLGHATVLVEIDGLRVLTDPVLSDRVSPIPVGPSRHYSGRRAMDNSTLWSAWLLQHGTHAVYLALVKIGAYGETWLDIHMDPESAVRASADLGATVMLPVHWATFDLSYHAWEEPIVRTLRASERTGQRVVTPRPGEVVDLARPFASTPWYARQGQP